MGAACVEQFHWRVRVGFVGANAHTWTGRILGTVFTAPGNDPLYGADSTSFRGKPVVKSAVSSSRNLISGTISPALSAAGSRPQIWGVMRLRTIAGVVMQVTDEPVTRSQPALLATAAVLTGQDGATNAVTGAYSDTAVHSYVIGYSSTGAIQVIADNVVLATAGSGLSLTGSGASHVGIGGAFNGSTPSDISFATLNYFSAAPSAAQAAALLIMDKATYGF